MSSFPINLLAACGAPLNRGVLSYADWRSQLGHGVIPLERGEVLRGLACLIDGKGARARAERLLKRRPPLTCLEWRGGLYRIVDEEKFQNGTLYYTCRKNGSPIATWKIFFAEFGKSPWPLTPREVKSNLLFPYRRKGIRIKKGEWTLPKMVNLSDPHIDSDHLCRRRMTYQNGHLLTLTWDPGRVGEREIRLRDGSRRWVWYPTPGVVERQLLSIPLVALSQIDEIRLSRRFHPRAGGQAHLGHRYVVYLYPQDETPDTEFQDQISGVTAGERRKGRLAYILFHEGFAHSLCPESPPTALRREMIKVMAAAEVAPSDYARKNEFEWFAEGVASRWYAETFMDDLRIAEWDREHPYFSFLLFHLLAVLEGKAQPLNDNIADWRGSLLLPRQEIVRPEEGTFDRLPPEALVLPFSA